MVLCFYNWAVSKVVRVYMTDDCYTSLGLIETYRQLKMNAGLAEDNLKKTRVCE